MITLTNQKVAGFEPRWAPFGGCTLLFDNTGSSLTTSGQLTFLDCQVDTDPLLSLYKGLRDCIKHLGRELLFNTYLFCPLPPASYHITVWDGVNAGNVAHVVATHRADWERFLEGLPNSHSREALFSEISASVLLTNADWKIQLRFERLENWSNVSLVARLAPANEPSKEDFGRLTEARASLTMAFAQRFGVAPQETYVPHVTLGYFANEDLARQTGSQMEEWNNVFLEGTAGLALGVHQVSLYGFTDMATFFKATKKAER